jgi:hypothetical protein
LHSSDVQPNLPPAIRLNENRLFWFLQSSIQASILNRLGDVGGLDFFGAGEIGDGAAEFEDATVGAGAQA